MYIVYVRCSKYLFGYKVSLGIEYFFVKCMFIYFFIK